MIVITGGGDTDIRQVQGFGDPLSLGKDDGEPFEDGALVPAVQGGSEEGCPEIVVRQVSPLGARVSLHRLPDGLCSKLHKSASVTETTLPYRNDDIWDEVGPAINLACDGPPTWLGFTRHRGRRFATTVDGESRKRVGLHIDSWDRLPLNQRPKARLRLCVNCGLESRFLYAVDASVDELLRDPELSFSHLAHTDPRRLVAELAAIRPDFPMLQITVPAGYAYLAPTENLIHDGASPGVSDDLTATWLGYFKYQAYEPRV